VNRRRAQLGFTLVEIVVAITISAIVVVFVSMFMAAPLEANAATSRRAALVAGPSDAWPRLESDLRVALPNSIRTRRNGNFVAVEMLSVVGEARYVPPIGASFVAWGTAAGGVFLGAPPPYAYLSVNNRGTAGADAYTLTGSMTAAGATITITPVGSGEANVSVSPPPVFTAESPRHRVYAVSGPVTYLCDETQGTLQRYQGYPIAANQASWDSPGEFSSAGVTGELIARGLTACTFAASAPGGTTAQTVAVHLTSTAANGDSVTLLHSSRAEYVP
jgi:prepilin-type N-terminal cleavage/methylation domain-containing protein